MLSLTAVWILLFYKPIYWVNTVQPTSINITIKHAGLLRLNLVKRFVLMPEVRKERNTQGRTRHHRFGETSTHCTESYFDADNAHCPTLTNITVKTNIFYSRDEQIIHRRVWKREFKTTLQLSTCHLQFLIIWNNTDHETSTKKNYLNAKK